MLCSLNEKTPFSPDSILLSQSHVGLPISHMISDLEAEDGVALIISRSVSGFSWRALLVATYA